MPRPEDTEWRKAKPRTPAPQIDPVFLWPTPNNADFLFFVERNGDLPANQRFRYGDPFLDRGRYPDHKLVYVTPQSDDKWSRWYYASDRINEDAYNWEFTAADIGGTKFDAVTRTYIIFRSSFDPESPAMGSAMPNVPEDLFSDEYILASRTQKRTGEQELDSLYVIEQRTYVKRCTLTEILGSKISSEERLYYKGELVGGVPVEELFDDPANDFWKVQEDGSSNVGKQLSCDWYSISTQKELQIYFLWPTPEQSDFLFYVIRNSTDNPSTTADYGASFGGNYPDHKLVYVSPTDERGRSKFYYAADRINQDAYNWEFTAADIGGTKFDAVTRTYLTPREDFDTEDPAMGSAMPDVPSGMFSGAYVLASRVQKRTGEQELDSLYVIEQRTYVKRCTLTEILGSKVSVEERLYYKGEEISGTAVETLFDDPANDFWKVQSDGSSNVGKQLSCDWYAITTQRELQIYFIWPTPEQSDYLFYVVRNSTNSPASTAAYGTSFGGDYPNHKLVHVSPTDERGRSKFYYAAARINEDAYNWQISDGKELTRTYVKLREDYVPTPKSQVGEEDEQFSGYVFADESVVFADEILRGLFIVVQKRYLPKESIEFSWNKDFECYIKITKEVIEANEDAPPAVTAGTVVEIQNVNTYYSIKITQELTITEFPYEKTAVPDSVDINFPNKLDSVELLRAYAWADSAGAAFSYDEDSNYKYTIKVPRAGPYEATIRRFVTDDPEALMASHPLTKIPVAQIDMVTEVWAWWFASPEQNWTKAKASALQLPSTIHSEITIPRHIPTDGGNVDRDGTETIPETPGYSAFVSTTIANMQHKVREMDMKLFEVSVVEVDITNLYS
jgi:hypothetical protein